MAALLGSASAQLGSTEYSWYDHTWPTGMYLKWSSSSGAEGKIQYAPQGVAVPDEGNGGMTRRAVLAPGNADCNVPFPDATNSFRGQEAGVKYDRDVFVVTLAIKPFPCIYRYYLGGFGPKGRLSADVAGVIFMMSDENDPIQVKEEERISPCCMGYALDDMPNNVTYPVADVSRGPGPIGGLSMVTEIFNGFRVDITWPGTGPMVDAAELAAMRDLFSHIKTANKAEFNPWTDFSYGRSVFWPENLALDDALDPCTNNGEGKHLYSVTCIGGHVVSIIFEPLFHPQIDAFPPSISALTELRHIYGVGNNLENLVVSCEFGQLKNLVSFVWEGNWMLTRLEFPEDDSCMSGLESLEELVLSNIITTKLPPAFLGLPNLQKVVAPDLPLAAFPTTVSPNLRVVKLSNAGISGPLPSFRGSALLQVVKLDQNNLQLGEADAFDHCPQLISVDASYNNLNSTVFHFNGSTNVQDIDISHNAIQGSIPSEWRQLSKCKMVQASHNNIQEPIAVIRDMQVLASVDLSHNRLQWESVNPFYSEFQTWITLVAPGTIRKLDLSHNMLKQITPYVLLMSAQNYPYLDRLDLSHNFLWGDLALNYVHFNFGEWTPSVVIIDRLQV
jgi:Leucine-rich repeat (LRR) protein